MLRVHSISPIVDSFQIRSYISYHTLLGFVYSFLYFSFLFDDFFCDKRTVLASEFLKFTHNGEKHYKKGIAMRCLFCVRINVRYSTVTRISKAVIPFLRRRSKK